MMASPLPKRHTWIKELPAVRGRYVCNAALAPLVWFKVGGAAEVLFRPADLNDLMGFLKHRSPGIALTAIGAGSNILVRDGGVPGVVVRLGKGFSDILIEEDLVIAGSGCLDRTVALHCQKAGVGGLEFLIGIPGTLGGALRMNAGAYGDEIKDKLVWAEAVDSQGTLQRLSVQDLNFSYRSSCLPDGWIFTRAALRVYQERPGNIQRKLFTILSTREATQPTRGRTGGSTFKNPPNKKAWELIDAAGCRGLKVGHAQVSEKHCNFFLNTAQATAQQLEVLGEEVQKRVLAATGVCLEWEIIRMGRPLSTAEIKQRS